MKRKVSIYEVELHMSLHHPVITYEKPICMKNTPNALNSSPKALESYRTLSTVTMSRK